MIERSERSFGQHRKLIIRYCMLLLVILCVATYVIFVPSIWEFNSILEKAVNAANDDTNQYLKTLKAAALFLSNKPSYIRHTIIRFYSLYRHIDQHFDYDLHMYIILRLLFDVPEEYPIEDSKGFDGFWGFQQPICSTTCNLLWPLGYQNGNLAFIDQVIGRSSEYNIDREYDYFATRFPLRAIEELDK